MTEYTITARRHDASLVERRTLSSEREVLPLARLVAANLDVVTLEITPAAVVGIDRIGTFFLDAPVNSEGLTVFTRAAAYDVRLDLPEMGTIGDLEGISRGLTNFGLEGEVTFPGFVLWSKGEAEVAIDAEGEQGPNGAWRVMVYTANELTAGNAEPTEALHFPFSRKGRLEAMAAFYSRCILLARDVTDPADEDRMLHEAIVDRVMGAAAPAPARTTIVVTMDGGLVQAVATHGAPANVEVVVLDLDAHEFADDDDDRVEHVPTGEGETTEAWVTLWDNLEPLDALTSAWLDKWVES